MFFEDFVVGQRFTSGERPVTEEDLKVFTAVSGDHHPLHSDPGYAAATPFGVPILQGPFGLAAFFGLFHELHLVDDSVVALLDSNWRYHAPIKVGDTLRFAMSITRCRRTSSGDTGVVDRHVALHNQDGVTVQSGTTAMLVRARGSGPDPVERAFGTVAWGTALAERLATDDGFTATVASWDGTVGLRCGTEEVQFRIYRGKIIDVTRRAPAGSTFTVGADELTWTELLTGPHNDFMRRVMAGQFETRGSGYEYLRLTKALSILIDHARALVGRGGNS